MPGGEFIPPPSLPSTAFSDSMTVENRLSMLHGGNARNTPNVPSTTSSSTSSSSFELASEGNADFDRKKTDIFANLGAIEQKHDAFVKASSSNKRMRDLADSCVKKDGSPNAGFDNRLFDEARKRSKESDGFASFGDIHNNVKNVMFERKDGGEAGMSSSESASSSSLSSFKMPKGVPSRNRGNSDSSFNRRRRDNRPEKPAFMKNPEKWKLYSLEDVKEVTQSSNSSAAFAFLDDLKRRKEKEGDEDELMEEDGGSTKIVFKAPSNAGGKRGKKSVRKVVVEDDEKVVGGEMIDDVGRTASTTKQNDFDEEGDLGNAKSHESSSNGECSSNDTVVSESLGSKFMMKEYVVGAKNPQGKTWEKKEKPKTGKEIKLSHLNDEEYGEKD